MWPVYAWKHVQQCAYTTHVVCICMEACAAVCIYNACGASMTLYAWKHVQQCAYTMLRKNFSVILMYILFTFVKWKIVPPRIFVVSFIGKHLPLYVQRDRKLRFL